MRLAGLLLILGSFQVARAERVAVLVATAEVKGTTEPCGCNSDPLGDVARVVELAKGGLLLDAGGLLFDRGAASPAMAPEQEARARLLGEVYGKALVGLGPDDLVRGADKVGPKRLAANVEGLPTMPEQVVKVGAVKVGVFGVVSPKRMTAGDPRAAAKAAIAKLRKRGAEVVVALLGMARAEAHELMEAVPGVTIGIAGGDVGEGMNEAQPVGGGWLVSPADQGRRAVRIEVHLSGGKLQLVESTGARKLRAEKMGERIAQLAKQIETWRKDPAADAAYLAERERELTGLERERAALMVPKPPPKTSWIGYELVSIRSKLPRDEKVAASLKELARTIGKMNFTAAEKEAPPPVEQGKASYVGGAACVTCHKPAVAFWQRTVHARAWKTLVEVDKQYNYECTGCHVTGLGQPGGAHLASVEKKKLVDVQCEVCHGPGSIHVDDAGMESPKTLVRVPKERFCVEQCHTKEHSDTFDLVPYLRDILGPGHGEKRRRALGDGPTAAELRKKALEVAKSR
jgi:hypothetical protein